MNKRIYFWTIVISVLLLLPDLFLNCQLLSILSSVGCSGIAAAIMSIFLEGALLKKENERQSRARNIYFKQIENQLRMFLERILWFDLRMSEDNFDWSKEPTYYSSFRFMIFTSSLYSEEKISYEDAKMKLEEIGSKYTLKKQADMTSAQLERVQKMFQILAASSQYLLAEAYNIKDKKIELDSESYISLEENDQMFSNISTGIGLMRSVAKNYDVAIGFIVSAYETIRKLGPFSDDLRVGLHGSIEISEL